MARVVLSHVKATPSARYGFIPRCVPWKVELQQDLSTGVIEQNISISVSMTVWHGYPTAEGGVTFFPSSADMADSPVPVLALAVVFSGELDEYKVLREIKTDEDWKWLEHTYKITKQMLGE